MPKREKSWQCLTGGHKQDSDTFLFPFRNFWATRWGALWLTSPLPIGMKSQHAGPKAGALVSTGPLSSTAGSVLSCLLPEQLRDPYLVKCCRPPCPAWGGVSITQRRGGGATQSEAVCRPVGHPAVACEWTQWLSGTPPRPGLPSQSSGSQWCPCDGTLSPPRPIPYQWELSAWPRPDYSVSQTLCWPSPRGQRCSPGEY